MASNSSWSVEILTFDLSSRNKAINTFRDIMTVVLLTNMKSILSQKIRLIWKTKWHEIQKLPYANYVKCESQNHVNYHWDVRLGAWGRGYGLRGAGPDARLTVHVLKFNIGHIRATIPQNYPKHLYFLHSPQFQPLKNQHLLCNYEFFNMKTRHRSIF